MDGPHAPRPPGSSLPKLMRTKHGSMLRSPNTFIRTLSGENPADTITDDNQPANHATGEEKNTTISRQFRYEESQLDINHPPHVKLQSAPERSRLPLHNRPPLIRTKAKEILRSKPRFGPTSSSSAPSLPVSLSLSTPLLESSSSDPRLRLSSPGTSGPMMHASSAPSLAQTYASSSSDKDPSQQFNVRTSFHFPQPLGQTQKDTIEALILHCVEWGDKFSDPEFPPEPSSLYIDPSQHVADEPIIWRRITDVCSAPSLFINGVEPGDVIQGALGDCWLLGPLSVIASHSHILMTLFHSRETSPHGIYAVRLFRKGEWVDVIVDDFVPCNKDGQPLYARCSDPNETWVMILEKAFAKVSRCYENLNFGTEANAFLDLTGMPPDEKRFSELGYSPDTMFSFLLRNYNAGHMLGCVAHDPSVSHVQQNSEGILTNHAYGILKVTSSSYGAMIRLRNPWGKAEWRGNWSDKSAQWGQPNVKRELSFWEEDTGCFWMSIDDFATFFNTFYICKILPDNWLKQVVESEWDAQSAGGCANHATWRNNRQFSITLEKQTELSILLTQPDVRSRRELFKKRYYHIGLYIIKCTNPTHKVLDMPTEDVIWGHKFFESREVTVDAVFEPGTYMIIACTFLPAIHIPYTISIYSSDEVKINQALDWESSEIMGEWTSQTAGGCFNSPQWSRNPQYIMTLHSPSKRLEEAISPV
eukprot:TRINITY_DN4820_c0_g1_i7.p1 TRINITY_DN4820_c0_g1~~TRINITY_DN4820_c0_g1_i7.p1  ORF type:complete len:702 (-),score=94.14 TRINITY_DN4820_c0_g1_i7:79-2184(-)